MSRPSCKALLQGAAALSLAISSALAGGKTVTVGTHKDFHSLDIVEVKELFKRSDFAQVRVTPFDLAPVEMPATSDNTHGVVVEAKAKFHDRLMSKVRAGLAPMGVETAEAAAPIAAPAKVEAEPGKPVEPKEGPAPEAPKAAAAAPRTLLVKGVVTKMSPGSAAARAFFGMFGGGQARVEITCEVIDAASGKVLATMVQARVGSMSGGWGYDKLMQNLSEEIGEEVAKLIKLFE